MIPNEIACWEQYLTNEDFMYLVQYIENIKNGFPNDKMIILAGPSRSGKSTLIKNINSFLGDDLCEISPMSVEFIYKENIKPLLFFNEISNSKKIIQAIINFIKYKQSFILVTNNIEMVNSKLIDNSKIIPMTHIF